jgi:hypothetical protein
LNSSNTVFNCSELSPGPVSVNAQWPAPGPGALSPACVDPHSHTSVGRVLDSIRDQVAEDLPHDLYHFDYGILKVGRLS